jgi:hypothetical protein
LRTIHTQYQSRRTVPGVQTTHFSRDNTLLFSASPKKPEAQYTQETPTQVSQQPYMPTSPLQTMTQVSALSQYTPQYTPVRQMYSLTQTPVSRPQSVLQLLSPVKENESKTNEELLNEEIDYLSTIIRADEAEAEDPDDTAAASTERAGTAGGAGDVRRTRKNTKMRRTRKKLNARANRRNTRRHKARK